MHLWSRCVFLCYVLLLLSLQPLGVTTMDIVKQAHPSVHTLNSNSLCGVFTANLHTALMTPHLFAACRLFLGSDWDFGDERGSSSPWFVDCGLGRGGSIRELHIPAVRRLPLPHPLEVLLPVLCGRSLHVSQVQSVEKLPYHQQSISGSWSMLRRSHRTSTVHTGLTSFLEGSFGFDLDTAVARKKGVFSLYSPFSVEN